MTRSFFSKSLLAAGSFAAVAIIGATGAMAGEARHDQPQTQLAAHHEAVHGGMDIVERAIDAKAFTTLVAAVAEAGLVETLKGEGPFTVFAPNDKAFSQLPEGTVADLLKPENRETLTRILTYHVLPGRVMSTDIAGQALEAKTVSGLPLAIDATGGSVRVGDATVTTADVTASNGVIHVIDAVLVPN